MNELSQVLSSAVTISGSALVKSGQKLGPSGGGVLELPGSKSISNRALVLAALAEKPGGKCRVSGWSWDGIVVVVV